MHPDRLLPGLIDIQKYFQTHGRELYRTTISLIAGLPHETLYSLVSTMKWIKNNWQGHHLVWFPLEIPLQSNGEGLLSELSLDPEKYGYVQSTVESDDHSCLLAEDLMNWQSPHMTRKQAQDFVKLFHTKNPTFLTTVAPLALGSLARPGYGPDEILSNPESPEVHARAQAFGKQLTDAYKYRKLS
jgi:hypothetical protein